MSPGWQGVAVAFAAMVVLVGVAAAGVWWWDRRRPRCGVTDGPGGLYGRCNRPAGHPPPHREVRDGKTWAEWN